MKKVLSLFLSVMMLLSITAGLDFSAYAADIIEVSTIEDLYNVRNNMSGSYKLMNDIDLTAATAQGGDWDFNEGRGWNPIGSNDIYGSTAFSGTFDGNGHSIIGMRINVKSPIPEGVGESMNLGLFASVSGTVKNLTVKGSVWSTSWYYKNVYAGAIAGFCSGKIENCHNYASVGNGAYYNTYTGGIVGYVNGGTISNCSNRGAVSASAGVMYYDGKFSYAGGIAGYLKGSSKVSSCFNSANVTSNCTSSRSNYVSGIAGYSDSTSSTVTDCYNNGLKITAQSESGAAHAAGIAGNEATIKTCYNVGTIEGKTAAYAIGIGSVSKCYYLSGKGTSTTGATSMTSAQSLLQTMYSGFDFTNVWTINNEYENPYPQLKNNVESTRKLISVSLYSPPTKTVYNVGESLNMSGCKIEVVYDTGTYYINAGTDIVTGYDANKLGTQTVKLTYKGTVMTFDVTVKEKEIIYNEVYTVADLYNIRNDMSANYKLMNDLDLTAATAKGGDWDFYSGKGWNPIGSNDVYAYGAFSGIFDGNGHKITGLRIDVTAYPSGTEYMYVGLFSGVSGTVKNLSIYGSISLSASPDSKSTYAGAIAGSCSGTIENCHNYASVTNRSYQAYTNTGGLVGYLSGNIEKSSNHGAVIATGYSSTTGSYDYPCTGGIAGRSSGGTVSECYNTANITGNAGFATKAYSSGIVGYVDKSTSVTQDCYNSGTIRTQSSTSNTNYTTNYSAGIVYCSTDLTPTIKNCYNTNTASVDYGSNYYAISNLTSTNCYYKAGAGLSSTGATSLTAAQLQLQAMFSGFDFTNTWIINESSYLYPQLRNNMQDSNSIQSVALQSAPTKVDYIKGQALDLTGCKLKVTYTNDTRTVNVTSAMISGFDANTLGTQTVTVTYRKRQVTFDVTVREKSVTGLTITTQPTKTVYFDDEKFDPTGMVVTASYDNGTEEVVEDYTLSELAPTVGRQYITVTFEGKSAYVEVEVKEKDIKSISVTKPPLKTEYILGDKFSPLGMEVTLEYNDGTTEVIENYVCGSLPNKVGDGTVMVAYRGLTTTVAVTVKERTAVRISVSDPNKTSYLVGEEFDPTGMVVTVYYDNNTTSTTTDYTISGFGDYSENNFLTVSYGDFSAIIVVTIHTPAANYVKTKEPTCTEAGEESLYCTDCGLVCRTKEIAALGHTETEIPAVAPTCTSNGLTAGVKCSVCGEILTPQSSVAKLKHDYESQVLSTPTCTEQGVTEYVCTLCGNSYYEYSDVKGHNWDNGRTTKQPSCSEYGEKLYTCSRCGGTYTEPIAKTAHTIISDAAVAPTCTTTGLTAGSHCAVCGEIFVTPQSVDALGHSYTSVVTAPTCTQQGYTTYTCTRCGNSYVSDFKGATGHDYTAVITAPTCTQQGATTYTCSKCGDTYVQPIAKIAHTVVTDAAVAPTCTQIGLTQGSHCSVCGEVFVAQTTVNALGHDYKAEVTAPTCSDAGYTTYTCSRCGDSYVGNSTEALGHNYKGAVTAPTCTETGYTTYTCTRCGSTYVSDSTEALGHDYKGVVTAPTCTQAGYTTYTCSRCGSNYVSDSTDALGHSWDDGAVTKKATPTATGIKTFTCTACGETRTEDIPKCAKYANPITVKAKTATVKLANLKKKNQTVATKNAYTVSKAQGKVTYAKSSGHKSITVAKDGKITVKKGLKKGTYKVKVKVTAAGNATYKAKTVTVTVTINVK